MKCARFLIAINTFRTCHPTRCLYPVTRWFSSMDGPARGKAAAAKAAVMNHVKVFVYFHF